MQNVISSLYASHKANRKLLKHYFSWRIKMEEINKRVNNHEIEEINPLPIIFLKFFGVWPSNHWNLFLKILYSFRTALSFALMTLDILTLCCVIYFSDNQTQTFFENVFYICSISCTMCKAFGVLFKQDKIVHLFKMLLESRCKPRDSVEIEIQNKTDADSRLIFKVYASMVTISLSFNFFLEPLIKSGDDRIDALNTWRPFDLHVPLYFWLTYFQQIVSLSHTPYVHMSVECIIFGFMQQACAQIRILQHRLNIMPELVQNGKNEDKYKCIDLERHLFSENVRHHIHILQYVKFFNRIFVEIMFIQCAMSLALICASVYQMRTLRFFSRLYFITILSFTICMITQLFLFCWYGNELMLQSASITDTLFEMDWTSLRKDTKSNVIIMMICTSNPIVITSGAIIQLNLNTFLSIIKASYSALNVLQQSVDLEDLE